MMRRCAFLTMGDERYLEDDKLAFAPMRERGWEVDLVPWRKPGIDWSAFDLAVPRSPWDYHEDPDAFLTVLEEIVGAGVRLENHLELVRWNIRKTYLRELADQGVPIVPTVWRDHLKPGDLPGLLDEVAQAHSGTEEMMVKPVIGLGAFGAFPLSRRELPERAAEVEAYFKNLALMAQPFLRSILTEGEYSLIYFRGRFSHAAVKTPKKDDFRVQEVYGGKLERVEPESRLREAGDAVMKALPEPPTYARVDVVRAETGPDPYWLMELELIEPSLFLKLEPEAPARFADALATA